MSRETETRKTFTGVVVSDKADKTIVVLVTTDKKHPLYSKRVMKTKKFHAHDEEEEFPCGKDDVSDENDPTYIERELKETLERENRVDLYIELFGEPEE